MWPFLLINWLGRWLWIDEIKISVNFKLFSVWKLQNEITFACLISISDKWKVPKSFFIVPHCHLLASLGSLDLPVKLAWIMTSFRTSFRIWSFLDWLCVARAIYLLYWALPTCSHGSTTAGTSSAVAVTWSVFLLKTLCNSIASYPIWNQLTFIQNLNKLLKLVHSHTALLCSITSWWLVTCWSVEVITFLHLKAFSNQSVHYSNCTF